MNKQNSEHKIPNTKSNKGITLIALIITIVVLLILAVVAIGAVKDSNIIAHAQNAASGYNQAKINETTLLEEYENVINDSLKTNEEKIKCYYTDEYDLEGDLSPAIITMKDIKENEKEFSIFIKSGEVWGYQSQTIWLYEQTYAQDTVIGAISIKSGTTVLLGYTDKEQSELPTLLVNLDILYIIDSGEELYLTELSDTIKDIIESATEFDA